jgi:hypothetical protein
MWMHDHHLPAFDTPRRILYTRIKSYFVGKLSIEDKDNKVILVSEKAEMVLDRQDHLNDKVYIYLKKTGHLKSVSLLKKNIGDLIREIESEIL